MNLQLDISLTGMAKCIVILIYIYIYLGNDT